MVEYVDFHLVAPGHVAVHLRLENWGLYLHESGRHRPVPMWRFTRSNSRMWAPPSPMAVVDSKDGETVERVVCALPTYHRVALKWCYIERCAPARVVRRLGVSYTTLFQLVADGRELVQQALERTDGGSSM